MDKVIIDSGSARLHTEFIANPHTETILFLHGGPGVPMDFSPVWERLSASYQLISFDQRGTGLSPCSGGSYSIDEYLADIEAIMQHFGLKQVHLFGHSWGGLYAQLFAERKPQRVASLFLVSPSPDCGPKWLTCEKEVMDYHKAKSSGWQWLGMGIYSLVGRLGSDKAYQKLFSHVIENYHKEFLPTYHCSKDETAQVRAEAINETRRQLLKAKPLTGVFPAPLPIALIYGEKDIYGESKNAAIKRLSSAQLVIIKNAGHIAWQHNPDDFFAVLKKFYQRAELEH